MSAIPNPVTVTDADTGNTQVLFGSQPMDTAADTTKHATSVAPGDDASFDLEDGDFVGPATQPVDDTADETGTATQLVDDFLAQTANAEFDEFGVRAVEAVVTAMIEHAGVFRDGKIVDIKVNDIAEPLRRVFQAMKQGVRTHAADASEQPKTPGTDALRALFGGPEALEQLQVAVGDLRQADVVLMAAAWTYVIALANPVLTGGYKAIASFLVKRVKPLMRVARGDVTSAADVSVMKGVIAVCDKTGKPIVDAFLDDLASEFDLPDKTALKLFGNLQDDDNVEHAMSILESVKRYTDILPAIRTRTTAAGGRGKGGKGQGKGQDIQFASCAPTLVRSVSSTQYTPGIGKGAAPKRGDTDVEDDDDNESVEGVEVTGQGLVAALAAKYLQDMPRVSDEQHRQTIHSMKGKGKATNCIATQATNNLREFTLREKVQPYAGYRLAMGLSREDYFEIVKHLVDKAWNFVKDDVDDLKDRLICSARDHVGKLLFETKIGGNAADGLIEYLWLHPTCFTNPVERMAWVTLFTDRRATAWRFQSVFATLKTPANNRSDYAVLKYCQAHFPMVPLGDHRKLSGAWLYVPTPKKSDKPTWVSEQTKAVRQHCTLLVPQCNLVSKDEDLLKFFEDIAEVCEVLDDAGYVDVARYANEHPGTVLRIIDEFDLQAWSTLVQLVNLAFHADPVMHSPLVMKLRDAVFAAKDDAGLKEHFDVPTLSASVAGQAALLVLGMHKLGQRTNPRVFCREELSAVGGMYHFWASLAVALLKTVRKTGSRSKVAATAQDKKQRQLAALAASNRRAEAEERADKARRANAKRQAAEDQYDDDDDDEAMVVEMGSMTEPERQRYKRALAKKAKQAQPAMPLAKVPKAPKSSALAVPAAPAQPTSNAFLEALEARRDQLTPRQLMAAAGLQTVDRMNHTVEYIMRGLTGDVDDDDAMDQ